MALPQLALAIPDPKRLKRLEALGELSREAVADFFDDRSLLEIMPPAAVPTHLYVGGEFCEHLLPTPEELQRALEVATRHRLLPVLTTPVANDTLIDRLAQLLHMLPADAEVVANDLGVARFVAGRFPDLQLVAGRQLAKMVKDPRLPRADWGRIYPTGFAGDRQLGLLRRFGIRRIELDLPPHADANLFAATGMALSVHAPFAYVAKGRICKIGGLAQEPALKFSPGLACNRECLGLVEVEQERSRAAQRTYQRGTTMFYRYDPAMLGVVQRAVAEGSISRLVVSEA